MKARGLAIATLLTLSGVFLLPSIVRAETIIDWATTTNPSGGWANLYQLGKAQYVTVNDYVYVETLTFRLYNPAATTTNTLNVTVFRCPENTPLDNYLYDCSMVDTYSQAYTTGPYDYYVNQTLPVSFSMQPNVNFVLTFRMDNTSWNTVPPVGSRHLLGLTYADPLYPGSTLFIDGLPTYDDYDVYQWGSGGTSTGRIWMELSGRDSTGANYLVYSIASTTCTASSAQTTDEVCNSESILENATIYGTTTTTWNRYEHYTVILNKDLLPVYSYSDENNPYLIKDFIVGGSSEYNWTHVIPFPNGQWTVGNYYWINSCIVSKEADADGDDYYCALTYFGNGFDATTTQEARAASTVGVPGVDGVTGTSTETDCSELYTTYSREWLSCEMYSYVNAIITVFPLGYLTEPIIGYVTYKNTHSTTSTSTHFVVGFNVGSYFDSDTGLDPDWVSATTTWDLTLAAQNARTLSPSLINTVEQVLWAMFMVYLAYRLYAGVWQSGISGGVDWYTDRKRYEWKQQDHQARMSYYNSKRR